MSKVYPSSPLFVFFWSLGFKHPRLASDSPHSQDDLELRILRNPPPEVWDDWCVALGMNLRLLRLYSSGQAPHHLAALPTYHQRSYVLLFVSPRA